MRKERKPYGSYAHAAKPDLKSRFAALDNPGFLTGWDAAVKAAS